MKKTILLMVIVALLVPAAAMAATEFSLGGFIKLDAFWDSTQTTKNMLTPIMRNNDPNFHHGRMKFTAQGSRFNFTIKGPKVFGADVTGFIEMDFDSEQELGLGSANAQSASNNYKPRLRHAMFRLNWPGTELLFGQYWSMFCEYYPEAAQDGPMMQHGCATARLPQIRLTQTFAGAWTVAALIGEPNTAANNGGWLYGSTNAGATSGGNTGEAAEAPQIQAKVAYEKDLWGKAAFYGKPRGFTAQITSGWQRNVYRSNNQAARAFNTWGSNNFSAAFFGNQKNTQYNDPWMVQGNLFIPVIPTTSANLAGTASLSAQWYIGTGLQAFGEGTGADNSYLVFQGRDQFGTPFYDVEQQSRYGGYVQAQYYFNNQWFVNAVWGMSKAFGVTQDKHPHSPAPLNYTYATFFDQQKFWEEFDLCLWYRPIQAIKFGLQYSYTRTDWFQKVSSNFVNNNVKDIGDAHRVEFVGFFFF